MTDEDKKLAGILALDIEEALFESIELTAKDVKRKYGQDVDIAGLKAEAHAWAVKKAEESAQAINARTEEILSNRLPDATAKEIQEAIIARAESIAITEVTNALAVGNVIVWMAVGIESVRWQTENDDVVCPICQENEDAGEIDIGEAFPSGDEEPPAHTNCRCYLIESV